MYLTHTLNYSVFESNTAEPATRSSTEYHSNQISYTVFPKRIFITLKKRQKVACYDYYFYSVVSLLLLANLL